MRAFGTVYKARDLSTGFVVALKRIKIPIGSGMPYGIVREIGVAKQLSKFNHPNVVRLLDVCKGPSIPGEEPHVNVYLVLEFMESDLTTYMRNIWTRVTTEHIKKLSFDILCGINFLHRNRILHRDLKPQNLLVSSTGQVKLADFGLAKIFEVTGKPLTSEVVTLWYRSPEILLGSAYGYSVDMWSFATILAELYRHTAIFPGDSEKNQLERIFDIIGTPRKNEWPADSPVMQRTFIPRPARFLDTVIPGMCAPVRDLLENLLSFNPSKRPTSWEALSHIYFSGLGIPVMTTTNS